MRLREDTRFRGRVVAASFGLQGALATLLFFVFSRVLANAGRQANSTWNAISETLQLYQTIFGFLLVSLSSQVASAHQKGDHAEVGRLIKLGLITSLVLGVVGEVLVLSTAPRVLALFEGNDELLEETPQLVLWSGATFALGVINATLIGILFGKADLIFVAVVFAPALLIAMVGAGFFVVSDNNLIVLVVTTAVISCYFTVAFCARIWRSRQRYVLDSLENLRLHDLQTFARASGNVAIKTLSIAIKVFLTFLFGTRLNNATGSVLTILQILSSPLLGVGSFLGVGATIFAARLLAAGHNNEVLRFVRLSALVVLAADIVFVLVVAATDHGSVLVTSYTDSPTDQFLYGQITTSLNMWLWTGGIVLQNPAIVFDGLLIAFADWGFVGGLYAVDFALVFLPTLLSTQLAPGLPIDGGFDNSTDAGTPTPGNGGFSRLSGILLSLLLHSAVRCVVGAVRVRARLALLGGSKVPPPAAAANGPGVMRKLGSSIHFDD